MSLDDFDRSKAAPTAGISEKFSPIIGDGIEFGMPEGANTDKAAEPPILDNATRQRLDDAGLEPEDIILSLAGAVGIDNLGNETNKMLVYTTSYNILNWYKSSPHVTNDQITRVINGVSTALHEGFDEDNQSQTTAIDWSSSEAIALTREAIADGALGLDIMNNEDSSFYHDAYFVTAMAGTLCKWSEESDVNMGRNQVICENLKPVVTSMRYFDRPAFHATSPQADTGDHDLLDL